MPTPTQAECNALLVEADERLIAVLNRKADILAQQLADAKPDETWQSYRDKAHAEAIRQINEEQGG